MSKPKIVYLIGTSHCGSTLLSVILGAHQKVECVGELKFLPSYWDRGEDCTCKNEIKECPFWMNVVKGLSQIGNGLNSTTIPRWTLTKIFLAIIFAINPRTIWTKGEIDAFAISNLSLYSSITKVSKKPVVLDSSKSIFRAFLLWLSNRFDIKLIYVNRDGKSYLASKKRREKSKRSFNILKYLGYYFKDKYMHMRFLIWLPKKNLLPISYYDLTVNCEETLSRILEFTELPNQMNIIGKTDENENFSFTKEINHDIGGNGVRLRQEVDIMYKDNWKSDLNLYERIIFAVLGGNIVDYLVKSLLRLN
ncbi:MAG: sulfotransferase [Cyclobacteriaceae bacterium]